MPRPLRGPRQGAPASPVHLRHPRREAQGLRRPGAALGGVMRFFIHTQHRGTRVWKMAGDASAVNVDKARARAASLGG